MTHPRFTTPHTYTQTPTPAQYTKHNKPEINDAFLRHVHSIQYALAGLQKSMAEMTPHLSRILFEVIKSRAETKELRRNIAQSITAVTSELSRIRSGQEDILRRISHQHNLSGQRIADALLSGFSELQQSIEGQLMRLIDIQNSSSSKGEETMGSGQSRRAKSNQSQFKNKLRRSKRIKSLQGTRRSGRVSYTDGNK
jgi:hypothetical protein